MNTTVTGRHMELTDALRAYIENALLKLEVHFDKAIDADVVLDVQKHRHIAEVNLNANGVRIHSKEASPDMYASVDAVIDKLEKQARKFKDRINRHQPRRAREGRDFKHAIIEVEMDDLLAAAHDDTTHRVVQHEKLVMRPMTVDEALMQFELVDDPFLVFFNAETSQVNVLYGRDNGSSYGLIEPQF